MCGIHNAASPLVTQYTQLLGMALAASSAREALMMLQGALAHAPPTQPAHNDAPEQAEEEEDEEERGGAYHPSAVPWLVERMADGVWIWSMIGSTCVCT